MNKFRPRFVILSTPTFIKLFFENFMKIVTISRKKTEIWIFFYFQTQRMPHKNCYFWSQLSALFQKRKDNKEFIGSFSLRAPLHNVEANETLM